APPLLAWREILFPTVHNFPAASRRKGGRSAARCPDRRGIWLRSCARSGDGSPIVGVTPISPKVDGELYSDAWAALRRFRGLVEKNSPDRGAAGAKKAMRKGGRWKPPR